MRDISFQMWSIQHELCTNRHLLQRIIEQTSSSSSIGKHIKQHGVDKPTIADNFSVLEKCWNKLDYLVYEILVLQDLKPLLVIIERAIGLDSREVA